MKKTLILALILISYSKLLVHSELTLAIEAESDRAGSVERESVYLLGLDVSESGESGQQLVGAVRPGFDDPWALTQYVREFADNKNLENIKMSDRLQEWNPKTDPYNFSAISVRDIYVTSATWQETGDTYVYISFNLLWMNIGHEIGTRFAREKIPELRSAISEFTIVPFQESQPPSKKRIGELMVLGFNQALNNLLDKVDHRAGRHASRNLANSYYITVAPPRVLPQVKDGIEKYNGEGKSNDFIERIPKIISAYLESTVLGLLSDEKYNRVVLLPNTETLELVRREWPKFAARASSLSNFDSGVFDNTSLLRVKGVCVDDKDRHYRTVNGLEIRTALTQLSPRLTPAMPGIGLFDIKTVLAGNVKLPLNKKKSLHVGEDRSNIFSDHEKKQQQVPTAVPRGFYFSPDTIATQLAKVVEDVSAPLINRLADAMVNYPNLNHPSLLRNCR